MSKRTSSAERVFAGRKASALKARIARTAVRDRDLDRKIAEEWSAVDALPR
jgi:hypothetical protein